jgi:uncharacterized LabA/DUF88 family protein
MKYIFFIDFDNWFTKRDLSLYSAQQLQFEFKEIIETSVDISLLNNSDEIELRLYSGWYQESLLTQKASILLEKMPLIKLFPIITSKRIIIKGNIILVDTLAQVPKYVWRNTLKEKKGLSYVRVNNDKLNETCFGNKENCPPQILKRISKNKKHSCRVDGCDSLNSDLFVKTEQKMVDTMIACDIITYSMEHDVGKIVVVSDDIDHFPALAVASQNKLRFETNCVFEVLIKNSRSQSSYQTIMSNFSININCYG